jgi:small subunit ribosomal protein S6
MFLLDSTKAAAAWDDTVKHVHDILTKHNSEIVASRQWDERRLAYPISGHKKATYLLTYTSRPTARSSRTSWPTAI